MEVVSWWVRGFLGKYPAEIMASLACVVLLFSRIRRRDGLPTNWPVIVAVPAISVNAGRVHEWLTEFLRAAPGMSHVIRGPLGSPVDVLVTANPADVAHVFTANFGNYPKGEEFAVLFDVLGDGIFNADGESWAFQPRCCPTAGSAQPSPRAQRESSATGSCCSSTASLPLAPSSTCRTCSCA